MAAVWMRVMSDLRARWRGAVLLAVLLGLGGGIAMTAAAGARRTTTSYERLLRSSNAYDVEVQLTGDEGPDPEGALLERVAALPQVAESARMSFVPSAKANPEQPTDPFEWSVNAVVAADGNLGKTIEVPRLLKGRRPNYTDPGEAMATDDFLRAHKLRVGDEFPLQLATFDELLAFFDARPVAATGPVASLRIVGSWSLPHDVSLQEERGILFLTPAFHELYHARIATLPSLLVRLRDRARDMPAFVDEARLLGVEDTLSFEPHSTLIARVDRALGIQSAALWAVAVALAAGTTLILGQAAGRWLLLAADELPSLGALGMSQGLRVATLALPALLIGLAGAVIAVAAALLLSPLVPVGLARELDPDLGFFADPVILALGAAAVLIPTAGRGWLTGTIAAGRRRSREGTRKNPSALVGRLGSAPVSPAVVTGVRFAVEPGRGKTSVPVRSVLAGTVLSIVAVVGAFVFGRSMEHMLATPSTFGWNWDLVVGGGENADVVAEIGRVLGSSRHVETFSQVALRVTTFRDNDLETLAITPVRGRVFPTMLAGRFPATEREVALATKTMRAAGLEIGDRVAFPGALGTCAQEPTCSVEYKVVGRVVHWGEGTDPDDGAAFTESGQARVRTSEGFTNFFVRLTPGESIEAAAQAIERDAQTDTVLPIAPLSIKNVDRVRTMPSVLAGMLAVFALTTIIHALLVAARRRRHDLAILKALGFLRSQVRATIAWQSMTTIVLALIMGIPAGIAVGRWTWFLLADRLGIRAIAVSPLASIAAGAAAVMLLAKLVALLPGHLAARARPAEILRTE